MAHLQKRGNVWWLSLYQGKGRPRIRKPIGPDRVEAEKVLALVNNAAKRSSSAEIIAEWLVEMAAELRAEYVPLESLAQDFLDAKATQVAPSTLRYYRRCLGRFVDAFSGRAFRGLTLGQVSRWLAGQGSRANLIRTLKMFGRYCDRERTWRDSALMRLKTPPVRVRKEVLSAQELVACENAATGTVVLGPFLAGAYAGLRSGEICHARLEFLDRKAGVLTVCDWGPWRPKSRRAREIPLHAKIIEVVRPGMAGWLFLNTQGRQWKQGTLCRRMKKHAGCRVHILRHTFVSRLLAAGVGSSVARDLAGHSSIAVTDGYAHTDLGRLREAIRRL